MRNFTVSAVSRVLFFAYTSCLVVTFIAISPVSGQAAIVSLPSVIVTCTASVTDGTTNMGDGNSCSSSTSTDQSATATYAGQVNGSGTGTVSNGPPSVSANASMSRTGNDGAQAGATASYVYYLSVSILAGDVGAPQQVPLSLFGDIFTSCQPLTCTDTTLLGQFEILNETTSQDVGLVRVNSTGTTSIPTSFEVTVGIEYQVSLNADVGISNCPTGMTCTGAVDIDPTFYIDPSTPFASDYQLNFSSGVINSGDVSATPLPAALPLLATGLGALGLFGWRRKRNPVQSPPDILTN
jgi:hypothetical protein